MMKAKKFGNAMAAVAYMTHLDRRDWLSMLGICRLLPNDPAAHGRGLLTRFNNATTAPDSHAPWAAAARGRRVSKLRAGRLQLLVGPPLHRMDSSKHTSSTMFPSGSFT